MARLSVEGSALQGDRCGVCCVEEGVGLRFVWGTSVCEGDR